MLHPLALTIAILFQTRAGLSPEMLRCMELGYGLIRAVRDAGIDRMDVISQLMLIPTPEMESRWRAITYENCLRALHPAPRPTQLRPRRRPSRISGPVAHLSRRMHTADGGTAR